MNAHAQSALRHAHGALHDARSDTAGMTPEQLDALRKADDELKIATKKLEAEELEQTEWVQGTLADADAAEKQAAATDHLSQQIHDLELKIGQETDPAMKARLEAELAGLKHNIQVQGDIEAQGTGAMESIGKMKDDIAKMQHQVDILNDIKVTRAKLGGDFAPTNTSTTITMDGGETVVTKEADFATDLDDLQGMLKDLEHQHELGTPETAAEDKALQDELAKLKKAIAESIMRQEEELQANKVAQSADFVPIGGPDVPPVKYASAGAAPGEEFPDAAPRCGDHVLRRRGAFPDREHRRVQPPAQVARDAPAPSLGRRGIRRQQVGFPGQRGLKPAVSLTPVGSAGALFRAAAQEFHLFTALESTFAAVARGACHAFRPRHFSLSP